MANNGRIYFSFFVLFAIFSVLYLFKQFLLNIAIGALLAVATSNVNSTFLRITNNKQTLSATLSTLAMFLLFIVPFLYAVITIAKYAAHFNPNHVTTIVDYIKNYDISLPDSLSFFEPEIKSFIVNLDVKPILTNLATNLASIGKLSAKFLIDMAFVLVFFFFCGLYGKELVGYLKDILPMQTSQSDFVLSEVSNVMSVVFYSTVANTIIQGFLFALIAHSYGFNGFLTGVLFGFSSLIPVVGGILIWGPICLYELANGNTLNAVVIALYSITVISVLADTFLKPLVIRFINSKLVKIPTNINELLIFFAMIAGISTFGFWGIMLGPAIVTFFISTVKLYSILNKD